MAYIAGHTFELTSRGRRCVSTRYIDGESVPCMVRWIDIRSCTESDIDGVEGLAHTGKLNAAELASIRTEVARENDVIWGAIIDAASAGSR